MSRYIDAEALLKDLKEELEIDSPMLNEVENKWINKGIRIAIKDVKHFPTADVVEVVRCKDCAHYHEMKGFDYKGRKAHHCVWHSALRGENDYCSDGIRLK